jgi:hypothetical protein
MPGQAALSLRKLANDRIDCILSSPNPRRSSSLSRFSYKSLPNTSVSREKRNSYLWSISLRRWVRWRSNSQRSEGCLIGLAIRLVS